MRGPLGKKPGPQGPVEVPVHGYQLAVCCQAGGEHGSGAWHPVGSRGPRKWGPAVLLFMLTLFYKFHLWAWGRVPSG